MQLTNAFTVNAAPDAVWGVLNDVERFAPYIPGFTLTESDGDRYRGHMKVEVGAVTAQYDLEILVTEHDAAARTVKAVTSGKERRSAGGMRADVTGSLAPHGDGTEATIVTDLEVTGRVAQFGRNILAEVAGKLLTRFVHDLETTVLTGDDEKGLTGDGDESAARAGPTRAGAVSPGAAAAEPVNLVDLAGASVAKRAIPIGLGAALVALVLYLLFGRH